MSPGHSPAVSLVVLAYRDAPALPALVAGVHRELGAAAPSFEIVIVDDGSDDDTAAVAEELATRLDRVRVVRHAVNRGVGAAFRTGVEATAGEIVGYVDGDGQYAPEDLPRLLELLASGADVVTGERVRRADPWTRRVGSRGYRWVLGVLYGLRLRDVNSGLKLYRREALERARPLLSDGPFFDAEILVKLTRLNAKILETPVRHLPRRHGLAAGASAASILRAFGGLARDDMRHHLRPSVAARALRQLLKIAHRLGTSPRAGRGE